MKLVNIADRPRRFTVAVAGPLPLEIVGASEFAVGAGSLVPVAVTVAAPAGEQRAGIVPIRFAVSAVDDPALRVDEASSFALP